MQEVNFGLEEQDILYFLDHLISLLFGLGSDSILAPVVIVIKSYILNKFFSPI